MSSEVPLVHQVNVRMAFLNLFILLICVAIAALLLWERLAYFSLVVGALVCLVYAVIASELLLSHHNMGMRMLKQRRFAEAIESFQRSYDFFTRHTWIDRYRAIVLLRSTHQTFREIALLNIAACHGYLGSKAQMKAFYERVRHEFPGSSMAASALQFIAMIESAD